MAWATGATVSSGDGAVWHTTTGATWLLTVLGLVLLGNALVVLHTGRLRGAAVSRE